MRLCHKLLLAIVICPALAGAQQSTQQQTQPCMPGMEMLECEGHGLMKMQPQTFLQEIVSHTSSGTGAEPVSTPAPMAMIRKGSWMLMFHANVFVLDELARSRQILLHELVHAYGSTKARCGHFHQPRDAKP
jgi:hypothetical protein